MHFGSTSRAILTASLLCLTTNLVLAQGDSQGGPKLAAEPYAEADNAYPGRPYRMALAVAVPEGWHINAHKPLEDFLIPTALELDPLDGVSVTEIVYPEPEVRTFEFSDESMAVYEGTVIIGVALTIADTLQPGSYTLKGKLKYQACNDTQCWRPEEMAVELPFTVIDLAQPTTPMNTSLFAAIPFGGQPAAPAQRPVEHPPDRAEPPQAPALQDPHALAESFTVAGRNSGFIAADAFIQWIDQVEAGTAPSELNTFAGKSLWVVILLTLVGGLALNLTPCVLPLIPINLAIIGAGAQAGSRSRGFALGALYGAGISLVYGVLGLVVVLTSGAFGTINASPWFNLVIAIVFVILGLAMFDVLLIDFTKYQTAVGPKDKKKGSFLLAFIMGSIAALLAGACVAPVVIAV
ncbi:MAG: hypothetical protein GX621_12075, partial [Pirellulaceae bacterium]|nr:hypothetical protein [Pirellulaceae bacterium]